MRSFIKICLFCIIGIYRLKDIAALVEVKMSSNLNCSYMARSSLAYVRWVFFEIFLSADLYRLCKLGIF
jgi:hypothetical protein